MDNDKMVTKLLELQGRIASRIYDIDYIESKVDGELNDLVSALLEGLGYKEKDDEIPF